MKTRPMKRVEQNNERRDGDKWVIYDADGVEPLLWGTRQY